MFNSIEVVYYFHSFLWEASLYILVNAAHCSMTCWIRTFESEAMILLIHCDTFDLTASLSRSIKCTPNPPLDIAGSVNSIMCRDHFNITGYMNIPLNEHQRGGGP
jgi:hypothetical protein